jgi:hypothetical protein
MCPYGVLEIVMTKISEVHNHVQELIKWCKFKILHLEAKRTKLFDKLIGLRFNMED